MLTNDFNNFFSSQSGGFMVTLIHNSDNNCEQNSNSYFCFGIKMMDFCLVRFCNYIQYVFKRGGHLCWGLIMET